MTKYGKINFKLFIRFTASAFRKLLSIYLSSYFPFGFEGRMCDLIVSVPDHCLSFYFKLRNRMNDITKTWYTALDTPVLPSLFT